MISQDFIRRRHEKKVKLRRRTSFRFLNADLARERQRE
jgi:hypothetical protein